MTFKRSLIFGLPLLLFLCIVLLLAWGLRQEDRTLPTALAQKPVPTFAMPLLSNGEALASSLQTADLNHRPEQIILLNFFASWCAPCRVEHPVLMRLAENPQISIFGAAYRDKPERAQAFLDRLGDPYQQVGLDEKGRQAIEFGLAGVPETFIIHEGKIVERIGEPLTNPGAKTKFLSLMDSLGVDGLDWFRSASS